jgi:adenine phosphoribosyltransferase
MDLRSFIRDVPDFPKPGVTFKDITPLLKSPVALDYVFALWAKRYSEKKIDVVVAMESRGFIFGAALASRIGAGFVPVRKPGKLPWKTFSETYDLEYGQDTLQIHQDALKTGDKVVIIDDVLATGGTAAAAIHLVEKAGGKIIEASFLIELLFLNGQQKLKTTPVFSIIQY